MQGVGGFKIPRQAHRTCQKVVGNYLVGSYYVLANLLGAGITQLEVTERQPS